MVSAIRSKVLVLLLLCFCTNLAVADSWAIHLHRRDGQPTTITTQPSPAPSQTGGDNGGKTGGETTTANATVTANSTSSAAATHTDSSITAITSNINGPAPTASLNFSGFNCRLKATLEAYVLTGFSYCNPECTSPPTRNHTRSCGWRSLINIKWPCLHSCRDQEQMAPRLFLGSLSSQSCRHGSYSLRDESAR
jgi:hypothetical protein